MFPFKTCVTNIVTKKNQIKWNYMSSNIHFLYSFYKNIVPKTLKKMNFKSRFEIDWFICVQTYFFIRKINQVIMY
jgi:hypothetical protein